MFENYYKQILINSDRMYYKYIGITKKDFPKWEGWKIINDYKERGIDVNDIEDHKLDTLVRNFYYLKFIEEKFQ